MLKKTIKFEDFEGNEVEETCYFNLTKVEVNKYDLKYEDEGGFKSFIDRITKAKSNRQLFNVIEEIVLMAYGKRSPVEDNIRFVKSKKLTEEFANSLAFDALMMSFFEDEDGKEFLNFINGILPKTEKDKAKSSVPALDA